MERIKQNYYGFLNIDINIKNIFRIENVFGRRFARISELQLLDWD